MGYSTERYEKKKTLAQNFGVPPSLSMEWLSRELTWPLSDHLHRRGTKTWAIPLRKNPLCLESGEKMASAVCWSLGCHYSSFDDLISVFWVPPPPASTCPSWSQNQGILKMCFPEQHWVTDPGQGCWQEQVWAAGLAERRRPWPWWNAGCLSGIQCGASLWFQWAFIINFVFYFSLSCSLSLFFFFWRVQWLVWQEVAYIQSFA